MAWQLESATETNPGKEITIPHGKGKQAKKSATETTWIGKEITVVLTNPPSKERMVKRWSMADGMTVEDFEASVRLETQLLIAEKNKQAVERTRTLRDLTESMKRPVI